MPEDKRERVNRELIELLNELRVALPGVQVLFAFLLTLPFMPQFQRITDMERDVYFLSFLLTAASSALLIAPSSYHRLHFREHDKERMLFTSNRLFIAGAACLAAAMVGVVFVVTDYLFGHIVSLIVAVAVAAWFVWFWYGLPISRRRMDHDR